jgi:3-phenylpropionate/trans-cinnamate dioxygenase ferredoxin reductase subunit
MPTLTADRDACQGYENCVGAAPDVFDVDDDARVVLRRTEIPTADVARVTEAVHSCPMSALRLDA